nr:hypothetical protein [Streptomyces caatingaensis]
MPETTYARLRRCHDCDGFPTVAVTIGTRAPDGTRETVTVACPACRGTGNAAPARTALTRVRG